MHAKNVDGIDYRLGAAASDYKKNRKLYKIQPNLSLQTPTNSDHLPTATTILKSQF